MLKAFGLLSSVEKISTGFGLKLSYYILNASEQVSYFERIHSEEKFQHFYVNAEQFGEENNVNPVLLRIRRRPQRYHNGAESHILLYETV